MSHHSDHTISPLLHAQFYTSFPEHIIHAMLEEGLHAEMLIDTRAPPVSTLQC